VIVRTRFSLTAGICFIEAQKRLETSSVSGLAAGRRTTTAWGARATSFSRSMVG
jgi:hypothetical protein